MKQLKLVSAFIAAILMATLMGCASSTSSSSEGVGGYWSDSVITTKVKSAIYDEKTLKVSNINVETVKGVVYLNGVVEMRSQIKTATLVARKVEGVKAVKSNLKVNKKKARMKKQAEPPAEVAQP